MRKEVRKAVVHQIHSLTQKANKLRMKNGSDEQKKKNALKADNFVSEIQILKKLKADEVSLFALSNPSEKDLKVLISKPIISPEARTMAKLCLRKNMLNVVNEFISRYKDSLELCNNLISERYSKTEKPNKKKKKKLNKKPSKESKQDAKIDGESQDNSGDLSDASDSIPQLITIPKTFLAEEKSVNITVNSDENESEIENEVTDDETNGSDFSTSDDMSIEEKSRSEDHDSAKNRAFRKNNHRPIISKNELKEDSEKYLVDRKITDKPQVEKRSTDGHKILNKIKTERKNVDPFFKTADDTEYFTYCAIKDKVDVERDVLNNSNSLDFKSRKGNVDSFNKGLGNQNTFKNDFYSKSSFQKNSNDKNPHGRKFYEKVSNNRNFDGAKTFNRGFNGENQRHLGKNIGNRPFGSKEAEKNPRKRVSNIHPRDEAHEVKLHPSWEAKKKLNQPPVAFQGKKIVFDD